MSVPTKYVPNYSFTGYQLVNPAVPLPAVQVDTELANVQLSLGQTIDALATVRRSDGALANQSVGPDQLSPALSIGFTLKGTWTAGVMYSAGDGVTKGSTFYSARVANTAAVGNAPDIDAVTWQTLFVLTGTTLADGSVTVAKLDPTLNSALARVDSQTFTGVPLVPTAVLGTNTTQIASTGFVQAALTALKGAVSVSYDTLVEIAADLVLRWNATVVHAFAAKNPVDADEFVVLDSASSYAGSKVTWANVKVALNTYFQGLGSVAVAAGDVIYGASAGVLARLAKGTDGQFLQLASGLPVWGPTVGSATQVLTLAGSPPVPGWAAIPTQKRVLIATMALSGQMSVVASSLPTTYTNWEVELDGVNSSGNSVFCNVSSDNGSTFDSDATVSALGSAGYGFIRIARVGVASVNKIATAVSALAAGGQNWIAAGHFATKTGVSNALRISTVTAVFAAGTAYVYGVL